MRNKEDKCFVITIIILLIILAGILILKESSSINIKKDFELIKKQYVKVEE
ncbi:MAG: hypothetical protein ACLVGD_02690 [Monoglobales bacterium]